MLRLLLLLLVSSVAHAAEPSQLRLEPGEVQLFGPRSSAQLLLLETVAEDFSRDRTRQAKWVVDPPELAEISAAGRLSPRKEGIGRVTATLGSRTLSVPLKIQAQDRDSAVSFRDEIIPILNRGGCNQGACHGTPNGKGGFKLSLRGFDVPSDFRTLTRDAFSRRLSPVAAGESLILQKATGSIPHQGGVRWNAESPEYQRFRQWIDQGTPLDPEDRPALSKVTVSPVEVPILLSGGDVDQQVKVLAHFADGEVRDVTALTCFSSSDDEIAEVSPSGLVHPLKKGEIAILCRYQDRIASTKIMFVPHEPDFRATTLPQHNFIDRLVHEKLTRLKIQPSGIVSDGVFLRRVYLDLLGVLPTPAEVRKFLADPSPEKRKTLIDALLERPEYAEFWALKWSDLLRLNESWMDPQGVRDFHEWIRESIASDKPLDQFTRQILLAKGTTLKSPQAGFFRTMANAEETAETVSQLFLGVRMNCARCHNHPFERWTQDEYFGLAAVFAGVKIENKLAVRPHEKKNKKPATLSLDPNGKIRHPRTGQTMSPLVLGGEKLAVRDDPRIAFADWLQEKPYFRRTMVNRIWFHLLGRGIVEPVDDFRDSNPAANEPLLVALAEEFHKGGFRAKALIRTIMNSRTYQTSAMPNRWNRDDSNYFSRSIVRMLTAEQMLDAVSSVTGTPEKFARDPETVRAALLVWAESDSPFLKTFHRPDRRLACECERDREPTIAQALQLIASRNVQGKISSPTGRIARMIEAKKSDDEIIEDLYLSALCRLPTKTELQAIHTLLQTENRREVLEDVCWSLLNSREFQFRQ